MTITALHEALNGELPAERVCTDPETCASFSLGGRTPSFVVAPATETEVATVLALACKYQAKVVPWGGGTKQRQIPPPEGYDLALDLSRLDNIVAHDPADLTMVVQAGCTAASVLRLAAKHGQWLPFDVPLAPKATAGGIVASAALGFERTGHMSVRDVLLGIRCVTGKGELVRAGGRVVKNVAGYDLMRLLAGSFGTLGVVTEVALRLWPAAQVGATAWVPTSSWRDALELGTRCVAEQPEPTALLALAAPRGPDGGHDTELSSLGLLVRYSGVAGEVDAGRERLHSLAGGWEVRWLSGSAETTVVERLRDFPLVDRGRPWQAGIRLALLPSDVVEFGAALSAAMLEWGASLCANLARGTVYVRFPQVDRHALQRACRACAAFAEDRRGWAWVDWWPDDWRPETPPLPHLHLSRGVKAALDPRGILNPGRYWGHW